MAMKQLKNELQHKKQFLKNLEKFGLEVIKEYSSQENKKEPPPKKGDTMYFKFFRSRYLSKIS